LPKPVHAELVEARFLFFEFSARGKRKERPFDKLRVGGVGGRERV